MSRSLNLFNLANTFSKCSKGIFDSYCKLYNIVLKENEKGIIKFLVEKAVKCFPLENNEKAIKILDNFIVSYSIPHISKQMDLLSLGDDMIVNIELNSTSTEDDILNQLRSNYYYLKATGLQVIQYSLDMSNDMVYKYDSENDTLQTSAYYTLFKELLNNPRHQFDTGKIDSLMSPAKYLVSPLNNTDRFLNNEYFLTDHQREIKIKIKKAFDSGQRFVAVRGEAGSGKTLLIYDIVKSYMENSCKVLIVHCGILNEGHSVLIDKGWKIVDPKNGLSVVTEFDLIVFDEVQRLFPRQYDEYLKAINTNHKKCVFSYDPKQCLKKEEFENDNASKIEALVVNPFLFHLKNTIRSNVAVSDFIRALFDKGCSKKCAPNNITVLYVDCLPELHSLLKFYSENGVTVPKFTPDQYRRESFRDWFIPVPDNKTAHEIIGQEFDSIAAVVGPGIIYSAGKLVSQNTSYYDEIGMLYQILTRAKYQVYLIVYKNVDIFERCLKLLY